MSTPPTAALGFTDALLASEASASIPAVDRIYDFLIGSWDLEVIDRLPDGTVRTGGGECHAAWVLEGRAIQDVWICPRLRERAGAAAALGNRFGTTLRIYDPKERIWHIRWFNPVTGAANSLTGIRRADRIEQTGRDAAGHPIRWSFHDIQPDSAGWIGEISRDGGASWSVQTTFLLRRIRG